MGHLGFFLGKYASLWVVTDRKTWVCPVWPSGCWETWGFTWQNCQWDPFGKNKNIYIDFGYSAVSNSASFVQFCVRSETQEPDRISHLLRRELIESISKARVSVTSVLKGLFPLGFFSNNSDQKQENIHDSFWWRLRAALLVFGVFSKIVTDFWFYFVRAENFLKKGGKKSKSSVFLRKIEKAYPNENRSVWEKT